MAEKKEEAIIIKKVKKGGHGGHHGGAWKVAYADFVTAMMAFFLVMWILGLSEETKKQMATYFNEPGIFDWETGKRLPVGMKNNAPSTYTYDPKVPSKFASEQKSNPYDAFSQLDSSEKQRFVQALEDSVRIQKILVDKQEEIVRKLEAEFREKAELADILNSISIEMTPEGLRIELLETAESIFFELGSATMTPKAKEVLDILSGELIKLRNKLRIEGHTDGRSYGAGSEFTNWELSVARANAARRYLESKGLGYQVSKVIGFADKNPRTPDNPFDPSNRRISMLVETVQTDELLGE